MAGDSFGRSAFISFAITLGLVGAGLFFKADLASSRGGTLIAGCMGAAEFVFLLTAISNLEMSYGGEDAKSGWIEVLIALLGALVSTIFVHRIAASICLLGSGALLFFLTSISNQTYGNYNQATLASGKKRK